MSSSKDYYVVLGVAESAEDVVIRAAYKVLAQKYHPDKNAHAAQSSTLAMAEITEAYRVLGDPIRRKEYDELCKGAHRQPSRVRIAYHSIRFGDTFKRYAVGTLPS